MYSNKIGINRLVGRLLASGITHFVLSPGSRNAPLVQSIVSHEATECFSIVDERSAAYFALGMVQQYGRPVALVSTSGTAALNYAPALAEAFYQRLPLVAITADRPEELIHQREGQAVMQRGTFSNLVRHDFHLPSEPWDEERLWYMEREVTYVLQKAARNPMGPVHLNVPLREPLYGQQEAMPRPEAIYEGVGTMHALPESGWRLLSQKWEQAERIMILMGSGRPGLLEPDVLQKLQAAGAVILAEHLANLPDGLSIPTFDQILYCEEDYANSSLQPDLLIVAGLDVVSKRLKHFLRAAHPWVWAVDPDEAPADTFKQIPQHIRMETRRFFRQLTGWLPNKQTNYQKFWQAAHQAVELASWQFSTPWSDIMAYKRVLQLIPPDSHLQLGNSAPVRYGLLFPRPRGTAVFANRGTSGIDGVISTASGAACASNRLTFVLAGDLTFGYDSNALWNRHLPAHLRIVVCNNQGGGIFRMIPGPEDTGMLEDFFDTHVPVDIEKLATAYGVGYTLARDDAELQGQWQDFIAPGSQAKIMEIRTPRQENAKAYQLYLTHIKHLLWKQKENGKA